MSGSFKKLVVLKITDIKEGEANGRFFKIFNSINLGFQPFYPDMVESCAKFNGIGFYHVFKIFL